jgi:hypothetical protein
MAIWVDLDRLSPSVLRHLAAAKESASRPRYDDTETMGEELGARPSAGTGGTASHRHPHLISEVQAIKHHPR